MTKSSFHTVHFMLGSIENRAIKHIIQIWVFTPGFVRIENLPYFMKMTIIVI